MPRARTAMNVASVAALLLCCMPRVLSAQQVLGVVRDSATLRPVPGAVAILTTSSGATVARTITNGDGRYAFPSSGDAARLRVLHIGFAPRELPLPAARTAVTSLDVTLASLTSMLDTVHVVARNRCTSGTAARAAALLEQAREGVLATDVAAEARPADMVRLTYVRDMDRDGGIASQSVRIVANRSIDSFRAVYTGDQFVQFGFQQDSAGYLVFFAPDARTIVDPGFAAGYCFRLASDRKRPRQVGLAFAPVAHKSGRVDITGTLWADTAKRELRDIEFSYLGLDSDMEHASPGGRIQFRALPNGVVLVDEWSLRLPVLRHDTIAGNAFRPRRIYATYGPQESGGMVATAQWPDYAWTAVMGAAEVTLRDSASGAPLGGAYARLENTDYRARADSGGVLRLAGLLPGPYTLTVIDSAFADLSLDGIAPAAHFAARAGQITRLDAAVPPPLAPAVAAFCPNGLRPGLSSVLVGRFVARAGQSVPARSIVTASWGPTSASAGTDSLQVQSTTSDSGLYAFCGLPAGTAVSVRGAAGTDTSATVTLLTPNTRRLMRRDLRVKQP